MKTRSILLACLGLLSHAAEARLGETVAECDARYGKPLENEPGEPLGEGETERMYRFLEYEVRVVFYKGRSELEQFDRHTRDADGNRDEIPAADRDVILLRNLGPRYQRKVDSNDVDGTGWKNAAGNKAYLRRYGRNASLLEVNTAAYEARLLAALKKEMRESDEKREAEDRASEKAKSQK